MHAADLCQRAARALCTLPLACPAVLWRAAVVVAERIETLGETLRRAAVRRYMAALLREARDLRRWANAYGSAGATDAGTLCRAMARAMVHDARASGRAIGACRPPCAGWQ